MGILKSVKLFLVLDETDSLCKKCHTNCKEGKCEFPENENFCYECFDSRYYIFIQEENELYGKCLEKVFIT